MHDAAMSCLQGIMHKMHARTHKRRYGYTYVCTHVHRYEGLVGYLETLARVDDLQGRRSWAEVNSHDRRSREVCVQCVHVFMCTYIDMYVCPARPMQDAGTMQRAQPKS